MAKLLTNINAQFSLSEILEQVKDINNGYKDTVTMFKDGKIRPEFESDDYLKNWASKAINAGYKDPIWNGVTFFPETHFKSDIVFFLDKLLGTVCTQCWINRLRPGQIAVQHRDFDGREKELSKYGTLTRYSIHMSEPDCSHMFWLEGKVHYMEKSGNLYEWDDSLSEHGGANTGFTDKYIFIYRGLKLFQNIEIKYIWQEDNDSVLIQFPDGKVI